MREWVKISDIQSKGSHDFRPMDEALARKEATASTSAKTAKPLAETMLDWASETKTYFSRLRVGARVEVTGGPDPKLCGMVGVIETCTPTECTVRLASSDRSVVFKASHLKIVDGLNHEKLTEKFNGFMSSVSQLVSRPQVQDEFPARSTVWTARGNVDDDDDGVADPSQFFAQWQTVDKHVNSAVAKGAEVMEKVKSKLRSATRETDCDREEDAHQTGVGDRSTLAPACSTSAPAEAPDDPGCAQISELVADFQDPFAVTVAPIERRKRFVPQPRSTSQVPDSGEMLDDTFYVDDDELPSERPHGAPNVAPVLIPRDHDRAYWETLSGEELQQLLDRTRDPQIAAQIESFMADIMEC